MRAALILHAVAHAAQWCPDDLFYPPPPPLSLPVFLSAPNASAPREVAFEVPCGGSVFDEATAFASKHAISAQARDELVEASHARQARGEPVARAVVITSLHARWALRRPGTLLLLVGASLDCGAAAEEGAAGLGFFETIDEARRAALQFNGSMLVLATGPEPVVSLAEVLAEHERIRHARGGRRPVRRRRAGHKTWRRRSGPALIPLRRDGHGRARSEAAAPVLPRLVGRGTQL